ncbi:type II toxin-antitoxin system VapC family toxin [Daejeonella sp.]|uniref:type II toxin-antitoxin system VapC family toxin n=1 Tax=Daejeonella sp. TaxID=2805397 RepID=UPI003983D132
MASKIFLDANIILEYVLRRKQAGVIDSLFVEIEKGKYRAFTSVSVIQICSYWIEKEFDTAHAKYILLTLLNNLIVTEAHQESVVQALRSSMSDIEDALQYYTAIQHRMDYFITLDKKFILQAHLGLPIYSPVEFMNSEY